MRVNLRRFHNIGPQTSTQLTAELCVYGMHDCVLQVCVAFDPLSTILGTASMDATAKIYDIATSQELVCFEVSVYVRAILNLRTELFCPLWTHKRSTEKMRLNLIAMKNKFSNARFKPGRAISIFSDEYQRMCTRQTVSWDRESLI